jgi:hypothetical protein
VSDHVIETVYNEDGTVTVICHECFWCSAMLPEEIAEVECALHVSQPVFTDEGRGTE